MLSGFKSIANFVPSICIISGLLAVFIAGENIGWVFVGGGAVLQALFFFSSRFQKS
ncbi:MAG: hypothetical protein JW845_06825 [Dehalococcoidales bacterium]|nr:hypothetical protein [Dehalococcoidales bacterium]